MASYELKMPKMGESVFEATIIEWHKNQGDRVSAEDVVLEVATDKVDSEIPTPVGGVISRIVAQKGTVVKIGETLAILDIEDVEGALDEEDEIFGSKRNEEHHTAADSRREEVEPQVAREHSEDGDNEIPISPLVRNIAKREKIELDEIRNIRGSGLQGRVTKQDVLQYVEDRAALGARSDAQRGRKGEDIVDLSSRHSDTVVELSRMQMLVADNMRAAAAVPSATSFVEVDVTAAFDWREKNKDFFLEKYGFKITFTAILMEAIASACKQYPQINSTYDGVKWEWKGGINIGMATAINQGDLIVPVVKNADMLNLTGIASEVHRLAQGARTSSLSADDIQGGSITMSNIGTFGNLTGIPLLNIPQTSLMAVGSIRKKPVVLETEHGDVIAVRKMMILSLTFDHRVINGLVGGSFLSEVARVLENFDPHRSI